MTQPPATIVRDFLAAWGQADRGELARYLSDDAVWVDGPQGIRRGADAILDELTAQLASSGGPAPEPTTLVADGGIVMAEWQAGWSMGSKWISTPVMAVFEVADDRITEMRSRRRRRQLSNRRRFLDRASTCQLLFQVLLRQHLKLLVRHHLAALVGARDEGD